MRIIARTNTFNDISIEEDEEEIPFDNKKFDISQKSLSLVYEKQQTQQKKWKDEILEQAIIDFWESIG